MWMLWALAAWELGWIAELARTERFIEPDPERHLSAWQVLTWFGLSLLWPATLAVRLLSPVTDRLMLAEATASEPGSAP